MQRFFLSLRLHPDPQLMAEYEERHRAVWPEVLDSLRHAGVVEMQICRAEDRLFMMMETTDEFSFERKAAMDRANPRVMEWERQMARFQMADPATDASVRWQRMEPVFALSVAEADRHAR